MTSLVLLSGGLDSATLLAGAVAEDPDAVGAVAFDYGQRHDRELEYAGMLADHYRVPLDVVDVSAWGGLLGGSALTDPTVEVPAGRPGDPIQAVTAVPNRLATLLSAAVGIADARAYDVVLTAVHAGDAAADLVAALTEAARLATEDRLRIEAPFLAHAKEDVARLALSLGVPVALTWSCYRGGPDHCGACGSCVERYEALEAAGGDDTAYEEDPAT